MHGPKVFVDKTDNSKVRYEIWEKKKRKNRKRKLYRFTSISFDTIKRV